MPAVPLPVLLYHAWNFVVREDIIDDDSNNKLAEVRTFAVTRTFYPLNNCVRRRLSDWDIVTVDYEIGTLLMPTEPELAYPTLEVVKLFD